MPSEDQIRAAQAQRLQFLSELYDREAAGETMPGAHQVAADIGIDGRDWSAIQLLNTASWRSC
jgi:hypothetical protein